MKDPNPVVQLHTLDLVRFMAETFGNSPPAGWDEFVRNPDLAIGIIDLSSYSNKVRTASPCLGYRLILVCVPAEYD